MKLRLFHGRRYPDEEMSNWGFEGPTIEGMAWMTSAYITTFTIGFRTVEAMKLAKRQTGWEIRDDKVLEVAITDDLIEAAGSYYGDFEILDDLRRGTTGDST
jgi:hypothetical protein